MSQMKKIVFLGSKSDSTKFVFNGLKKHIDFSAVIIEDPPNKIDLFQRRLKKLGWLETLGQILFIVFASKIIHVLSKRKRKRLLHELNLDSSQIDPEITYFVQSVNSTRTIEILKEINPDLVIVNGTRIIAKKVLNAISSVFINTHVGITPKYRGVHGGYWALANNDMQHFGVTVHKIDAGIDTGEVLYQKVILPTSSDNFSTYPLLQTAEGIKLILNVIEDFNFEGLRSTQSLVNESKLWYHPTLWGYLYLRIKKGIK